MSFPNSFSPPGPADCPDPRGLPPVKPCSTILVGSSVEFEFALLTLVFLLRDKVSESIFWLRNEQLRVVCHPMRTRFGDRIGTAYIEDAW